MKANKSKVQGPKAKVQACLRCGCTEDRACAGGCSWVFGSNVCNECLTAEEYGVYAVLMDELQEAGTPDLEKRALNRVAAFGRFLNEMAANEPIPYRVISNPHVTPKGGAK